MKARAYTADWGDPLHSARVGSEPTMTDLPEGWYNDGSGRMRWWTGQAWSEHIHPSSDSTAPAGAAVASRAPNTRLPKWPFIVGGVFVVLVMGGVVAVFLFASWISGLITAPGTPGGTVAAYAQAIDDDDCDLFFSVTSDEFRAAGGIDDCADFSAAVESAREAGTDRSIDVLGFSTSNDTATVNARESLRGEDDDDVVRRYALRDVDGAWRITGVTTDDD